MTNMWGSVASLRPAHGEQRSHRRPMGAAERRGWSSIVRQETVGAVVEHLNNSQLHGVVVLGPRGVGKTTLARSVERQLAATTHVVGAFGSGAEKETPFGIFPVYFARLNDNQTESPLAVLNALVNLITDDAKGKPIVVVLDELPGIDTLSMGVLMHLVLGGLAKLLVMARSTADLPEDLVWMIKDGLLAQQRIAVFTRAEVRTLLVKALDAPVAESVVATLYTSSAGNPLVLQALASEYLRSGVLRAHDGIWILHGRLEKFSTDILVDLVDSRLCREPLSVRRDVEKFSLMGVVSFKMAIQVLGADTIADLEMRGILTISPGRNSMVSFVEHYFGETIRSQLTAAEKAVHFQELAGVIALDPAVLSMPELLTFAAWINDANLDMSPQMAFAAANAAVHFFDPQLALACCDRIPHGHPLAVPSIQVRSSAHYLQANYVKAAEVLESVEPAVLMALDHEAYASWAMDLTRALLWSPKGYSRIEEVLKDAAARIQGQPFADTEKTQRILNLARFEFLIHRGEFAQVMAQLEEGSNDTTHSEYRLNCACLLTVALAATGRALDAVELAQRLDTEVAARGGQVRMGDWHFHGHLLALAWNGEWRSCEVLLQQTIERSNGLVHYRGGVLELALGIAYAFAGRNTKATGFLLTAAAQLEIRDSYNSLELVYSVLAYTLAKEGDTEQASKYMALAKDSAKATSWPNMSITRYFRLLALHSIHAPAASTGLIEVAEMDAAQGRFGTAAIGAFGAVSTGHPEHYPFLAQVASNCQGPLGNVYTMLAQSHANSDAPLALEAADAARVLELPEIEQHCLELALVMAKAAGSMRLARTAQQRLNGLAPKNPQGSHNLPVPLTSRELQIARLAVHGMSNRVIATKIGISVRTVEGHLYQVFSKMDIASRADLESRTDL